MENFPSFFKNSQNLIFIISCDEVQWLTTSKNKTKQKQNKTKQTTKKTFGLRSSNYIFKNFDFCEYFRLWAIL